MTGCQFYATACQTGRADAIRYRPPLIGSCPRKAGARAAQPNLAARDLSALRERAARFLHDSRQNTASALRNSGTGWPHHAQHQPFFRRFDNIRLARASLCVRPESMKVSYWTDQPFGLSSMLMAQGSGAGMVMAPFFRGSQPGQYHDTTWRRGTNPPAGNQARRYEPVRFDFRLISSITPGAVQQYAAEAVGDEA